MNANWLYRRGLNLLVMLLLLAVMGPAARAQQSAGDRTYRIIVMDNLDQNQAREVKKLLEGWSLLPVIVQPSGAKLRVVYGDFPNHAAAVRAKQQLEQEGILNGDIISEQGLGAPTGADNYTVVVQEFIERPMAMELRDRLEKEGFGNVQVRRDDQGNRIYYQVTVGAYSSVADAQSTLSEFIRRTYSAARVQTLRGEAVQQSAAPVATQAPSKEIAPPPVQQEATLSPLITQSDIWKGLNDEQKRQVIMQLQMEREQRSGNVMVSKIIDLEKRMQNLDAQVQNEIKRIQDQDAADQKVRERLTNLYNQARNSVRAEKHQDAIKLLREIAEKDPDNRFGFRNHAQAQIERLDRLMNGELYEGQKAEIKARRDSLMERARQLGAAQDIESVRKARDTWEEIQLLDPSFKSEASRHINELTNRLNDMIGRESAEKQKSLRSDQLIKGGLGVAIVLTFVMLLLVWSRGRKRHQELMRKVQEITTIRPMRELGTNETPLLGAGPSAKAAEPDIFTPRTPRPSAPVVTEDMMANAGDPLAGMAPAEPAPAPAAAPEKEKKGFFGRKKKAKEEPKAPEPAEAPIPGSATNESLDALFGGATETAQSETMKTPEPEPVAAEPKAMADDFNLDDIFGGTTPSPAPKAAAQAPEAAPAMASAPADEDPFASLFNESPAPKPAPVAAGQAQPAESQEPVVIGGASVPEADNTDLLSIFDEVAGGNIDGDQTRPQEKIEMAQDDPFAQLMGSAPTARPDDETEIPGIKLDEPAAESPFSFSLDQPDSSPTKTQAIPDFVTGGGNGASGVSLDFEDDALGQSPQGWEGHYDYAKLTVEADTPCKSGNQYIRFQKHEGNGKAHYRFHFADVGGVVGIEFDLCCNDKNKFLLGFYVERDGDFQQSVHTKILRSEAQTTPTIHMQGEAAPYLLGSWAHIKYIVDMNQGRINGYIDSTHVVRDLPLNPNPQVLNTLSIRDNINTTGDLMLDNIKVYQVS
ncbi:hypothetical protein LLG95_12210 [bacterium]|nr:hypothetical protein [bacterium]